MPSCFESHKSGRPTRCAVCDGKFGLVRLLVANPLCSRKCVDRFGSRGENERNWVGWLQITMRLFENRARAS
jgi:hypothetical protein